MEKIDDFVDIFVGLFCLSIIVFMTLFFAKEIFFHFFPPKTIEENGYTYHLVEEYNPPESIEYYGETYVLVEE